MAVNYMGLPQRKGVKLPVPRPVTITSYTQTTWPGVRVLDSVEQDARLAICNPCQFNKAGKCSLCQTCGGRPVTAKVRLNVEFCPKGLWGKL